MIISTFHCNNSKTANGAKFSYCDITLSKICTANQCENILFQLLCTHITMQACTWHLKWLKLFFSFSFWFGKFYSCSEKVKFVVILIDFKSFESFIFIFNIKSEQKQLWMHISVDFYYTNETLTLFLIRWNEVKTDIASIFTIKMVLHSTYERKTGFDNSNNFDIFIIGESIKFNQTQKKKNKWTKWTVTNKHRLITKRRKPKKLESTSHSRSKLHSQCLMVCVYFIVNPIEYLCVLIVRLRHYYWRSNTHD